MQTTSLARSYACALAEGVSESRDREIAMTFDLEEDFENERWRLLALVDWRKNLSDASEGAIKTDSEIVATRELLRTYETLKGFWSQKDRHKGHRDGRAGPGLTGSKSSQRTGRPKPSAEQECK
jgi:hypothetical protein